MNTHLLIFVGSLREKSYNLMLAKALLETLPEGVTGEIANFSNLPLFSEDLEANFPVEAQALKDKIRQAGGVVIVTPEYNRSIPGGLKNALDWTSRPYGDNAWVGKTVLVLGASVGNVGTALAQYHLKQILAYLDTRVIGQPEFYLGQAQNKFDEDGKLTDETTRDHLQKAVMKLLEIIE